LRALLLAAAAVALVSSPADSRSLPDLPIVSTFAGSGAPGIADGSGANAQFEGPQGLAFDARGNLYVADTPAQRVRIVDRHGVVKTLAGSGAVSLFGSAVPGGYRDGPSSQAQFDGPTGVAVGTDGAVYVADFGNHCIRKIQDGRVSTFAGSPTRVGHDDGPIASATFTNPRSVAADRDGSIYVTDYPNNVRRISPDGTVSTFAQPWSKGATALAVYDDGSTDELLVATADVIGLVDLRKGGEQPFVRFGTTNGADTWRRMGQAFVGPPSAVAPINADEFVYADALFSTVHLVQIDRTVPWNSTQILGAQPLLNAAGAAGGFRDGPGSVAQYNQPTGVAVSPTGAVVVADTGNKRLRLLSPFNRISYTVDHEPLPSAPDPKAFRISIVGNSLIWSDVSWSRSIAGTVEKRLCAARPKPLEECNVSAYLSLSAGGSTSGMVSYIKQYLAYGLVNVVVFVLPTPASFDRSADDTSFGPSLEPMLRGVAAELKPSGTRFLTVIVPGAFQMQNEDTIDKLSPTYLPIDPGVDQERYLAALSAVEKSGTAYLDLWPSFYSNDSRAGFQPLFRSVDHHLTEFGNAFVGDAIARAILRLHVRGAP
jgi:hypothetical protein